MPERLSPRHRCLRGLRAKLGSEIYKLVATFTPMTCMPAFAEGEQAGVCTLICSNIQTQTSHWLAPHIDRPTHCTLKVSAYALAESLHPRMRRGHRVDADAVYVLFMLRGFITTWAAMTEREIEGLAEWDWDVDGKERDLTSTPLSAAVGANAADVVRLFLDHRADPNGYQHHVLDGTDGESYNSITPLFNAITRGQPHLVGLLLLAKAEPDEFGYEMVLNGEAVHPDGGHHTDEVSPLWQAVCDACESNPTSKGGQIKRALVQLLLCHGASPNAKGKIEYFFGGVRSETESEWSKDSEGNEHTSDSETTPLQAACKRQAAVMDPEVPVWEQPDPYWSTDVVEMLRAL